MHRLGKREGVEYGYCFVLIHGRPQAQIASVWRSQAIFDCLKPGLEPRQLANRKDTETLDAVGARRQLKHETQRGDALQGSPDYVRVSFPSRAAKPPDRRPQPPVSPINSVPALIVSYPTLAIGPSRCFENFESKNTENENELPGALWHCFLCCHST